MKVKPSSQSCAIDSDNNELIKMINFFSLPPKILLS